MLLLLKIHILTVLISISGFILRGIWMMQGSGLLNKRWVKITPHINDTVLLVTGIALVIMTKLYPWQNPWLMAKVIALIVYILLGTIALKRGKNKTQKFIAWLMAILVFGYMLMVAKYHAPWPFSVI